MLRKSLSLIVLMMLCATLSWAQKSPNISVFADHIYSVVKQDSISFEEAARQVYDAGVRGVDVYVNMNPDDLAVLHKIGFQVSSAILVTKLVESDCEEDIAKAFAFMRTHHYQRLMLVPGLMPENPTQEMYDKVYQRMERFAVQAQNEGIEVSVEDYDNVHSPCYNTALLDRLFEACPSIGLTFDTGNFCFCNEDVMEARQHFASKIMHVHLKDRKAVSDGTSVPVGSGIVPIRAFVESLLQNGYEGWFTIECYGNKTMLSAIQSGAKFLSAIE